MEKELETTGSPNWDMLSNAKYLAAVVAQEYECYGWGTDPSPLAQDDVAVRFCAILSQVQINQSLSVK